jgi:Tfp pilus assembly protein PilF
MRKRSTSSPRSTGVLPVILGICALFAGLASGFAQQARPQGEPPVASQPSQPPLTEKQRVERLFEQLKSAPDANAARGFAERIERGFEKSGSDTADLLLQRAKQAIEAKELPTALDLLDFVVTLRPDWAEAYHRRALVHFLQKDEEAALRDIRATLAREPRHWHALAGLGALLRQMGQPKPAYRAFRAAMEVYPHFGDLKQVIEKMRPEIEGNPA